MCREEAAKNALLPAVLLRGCRSCPDLRRITLRLDDLYGASVGTLVRRVGDWQTTGLYAGFIEDRFAMEGDAVLAPMVDFLRQLLLEPVLEEGVFSADFVSSEKKNLISAIESQLNDKRAYAMEQLVRGMCREDSFGLSRLGEIEDVEAITPEDLYAHYRSILRTAPMDIFYVGSAPKEQVAALLKSSFGDLQRACEALPAQTALRLSAEADTVHQMDVNQGKLCMGFVTDTTIRDEGFVAMQLLNMVFGGGMTSKLFTNIREKQSLCYAIGSGYHGSKGLLTVSAGIDSGMDAHVRRAVLEQLEACRRGEITREELEAARQAMHSSLRATHDSPGSIENYYATAALSGLGLTPEAYMARVEETTVAQLQQAANSLRLHSVYFLKGVTA
jgi:predicted Zn-dependent peptidase